MPKLLLIRGLPGSGKSTLAKSMREYTHVEADMYFMRDGKYQFDQSLIAEAHSWCLFLCLAALDRGENVVVSNTFVRLWEMESYKDLGYPCSTMIATGSFANSHDVPSSVIDRMRSKWQNEVAPSLILSDISLFNIAG